MEEPEERKRRQPSALRRQTQSAASGPISNVIGERVRQSRLSQKPSLQTLYERVRHQSGFEMGNLR
jgi:hypothetical protein